MKVILKENGNKEILKTGTLKEVKTYLINNLDNLVDWLKEDGNKWDDFIEMKNNIKKDINNADCLEDLKSTFENINNEMGWWGIYLE